MVVFDSSTLILLAKAELLDSFLDGYKGKVLIPREVEAESCRKKKSYDALLIQKRIQEKKIRVARVKKGGLCIKLMQDFRIDRGEAEALVLAIEKKAKLVATDDKHTIRACRILKIPFTSAIAILVRMTEWGVIDIDDTKIRLEALIQYGRYSKQIIKMVKEGLNIG